MAKHPLNGLTYGTIRRCPVPAVLAYAILLEEGGRGQTWEVIDLYGTTTDVYTDAQVADWPIVYTPVDDEEWDDRPVAA